MRLSRNFTSRDRSGISYRRCRGSSLASIDSEKLSRSLVKSLGLIPTMPKRRRYRWSWVWIFKSATAPEVPP